MMRALYQIGKLVKSGSDDPLADIVDRVAPGTHVIALELQTDEDGTVSLVNPEAPFRLLFEASEKDSIRLGYKKGKSERSPNITPTSFCTFNIVKDTYKGDSPKIRTFDGKIIGFYRKYHNKASSISRINEFFKSENITALLRRLYFEYIVKNYESLPKKNKHRRLLTVTVNGQLPGECDEYRSLILESKTTLLGSGKSEGIGKCALSFDENTLVYGEASSAFQFYTVDKPGMITGGFQKAKAWKNFPVSAAAGEALKLARDYLNRNQKFHIPPGPKDHSYWVIPKFVFDSSKDELREILIKLSNYSETSPGFGFGKEASSRFEEIPQRIKLMEILAKSKVLLSFLFWQPNQKQLKINLLVDDIPPTRLKRLIEAQRAVAQLKTYSFWQNETSDDSEADRSIRFSFGLIWSFYDREAQRKSKDKKLGDPRKGTRYREDYLRFIRELYLGYAPDPHLILRLIMEYLEALHKDPDDNSFLYKPLYALCWLRFLCELGLWQPALNYKGEIMKLDELSIEPVFKKRDKNGRFSDPWMAYIEDFYQEHQTMLANPFLFGTFLLGCLVRMMMNIQAHKLSSTPFEKELKGLRLKKSDIPILFSKTMAKLRDYEQGDTYKVLDELISDLCLRGNHVDEQISNEEVSAWLAFGLAQGRVFKKLVDLENEKNNTNTSNSGEGE